MSRGSAGAQGSAGGHGADGFDLQVRAFGETVDATHRHEVEEGSVPKAKKNGEPKEEELPSTLQRSPEKAQRTFAKAHDSAAEEYGEGERAHRVAYAAVKHSFEKVGDHWEPKESKGPSDPQAEGGVDTDRETAGGVDANASKSHLYDIAKRLDIGGRSRMSKDELVEAIQKANDRKSREARES